MTNPTLLVTGAGGAIGRRLRVRLDGDGYDASYVLRSGADAQPGDPAVDVADITDAERLSAIVERRRPDAIIHLAAVTGAACDDDPERAHAVNVEAVRSLAQISVAAGVTRLVLASTSAVYGDQYDAPITESGPLALASRYAEHKREAEVILEAASRRSASLSAVALRIFNVFGPGMRQSLANRLEASTPDAPVQLAGLDGFIRDYVHVDDVADALVRAAVSPLPDPWTIINVGTGRPTTNRELLAALQPVSYVTGTPRASYSCADVAVARRLLEFTASRPLNRATVS